LNRDLVSPDTTLETIRKYRSLAAEAERLASSADSMMIQVGWAQAADVWRAMADSVARTLPRGTVEADSRGSGKDSRAA
jgi:hypothetical protein